MPLPRVLAIVLTHNAPEALARCLDAIDGQSRLPDRVLVVDNASRVPVSVDGRATPIDVERSEENAGPAGGHARGLETFLRGDGDLAWVMDDDCIPAPHCLERLLERRAELDTDAPVFPWWVDVMTGQGGFIPAWCGFVISRTLVERIGLPRADFVWWAEDTEYLQWRVYQAGLWMQEAPLAVVEHRRVRATPTRPAWKVYYEVRNTVYFRLYLQRAPFTRFRRMFRSLAKLLGEIVREDHRPEKLAAYVRGVFDGVTGRLGLRVQLG